MAFTVRTKSNHPLVVSSGRTILFMLKQNHGLRGFLPTTSMCSLSFISVEDAPKTKLFSETQVCSVYQFSELLGRSSWERKVSLLESDFTKSKQKMTRNMGKYSATNYQASKLSVYPILLTLQSSIGSQISRKTGLSVSKFLQGKKEENSWVFFFFCRW